MTDFELKIKTLIDNADDDVINDFFWSEMTEQPAEYNCLECASLEFVKELKSLNINFKRESIYGGEGKGDDFWSVYSFIEDTEIVYVKFDGYYQSYNGSTFEQWYFVEPKEVTVMKYVKK